MVKLTIKIVNIFQTYFLLLNIKFTKKKLKLTFIICTELKIILSKIIIKIVVLTITHNKINYFHSKNDYFSF